ncbi:hypothetical protein D3C87_1693800 [compost metagenome]
MVSKFGSIVNPSKPPWPSASTFGNPVMGSETFPSVVAILNVPSFSVMSKRPSGKAAIPQGDFSVVFNTTPSNAVLVFTPFIRV